MDPNMKFIISWDVVFHEISSFRITPKLTKVVENDDNLVCVCVCVCEVSLRQ